MKKKIDDKDKLIVNILLYDNIFDEIVYKKNKYTLDEFINIVKNELESFKKHPGVYVYIGDDDGIDKVYIKETRLETDEEYDRRIEAIENKKKELEEFKQGDLDRIRRIADRHNLDVEFKEKSNE